MLETKNEIELTDISSSYFQEITDRTFHAKASVYGAIKFALFSGISVVEVQNWFPDFENNEELIMGINEFEDEINKLVGDGVKDERLKGIYDGEKRIQIYELSEKERENIPIWFKGPFYIKGGLVTSKLTGNEYELSALEKSIFTEIQYNTVMITIVSETDNVNRDTFNNPFFDYLVQVVDNGTEWFRINNPNAFNSLFEHEFNNNDKSNDLKSIDLKSNDDKLVAFIGLMISLAQIDDVFCEQENIYIENFVSQLGEKKRKEILEKLNKKEFEGLISIEFLKSYSRTPVLQFELR